MKWPLIGSRETERNLDLSSSGTAPRLACRPRPQECLLLPSVHLFDPSCGVDLVGDLLVENGCIAAMGGALVALEGPRCRRSHRLLGLSWLRGPTHVHMRTPGQEYKEDFGQRLPGCGGRRVRSRVGMANTEPPVDVGPLASWVLDSLRLEPT